LQQPRGESGIAVDVRHDMVEISGIGRVENQQADYHGREDRQFPNTAFEPFQGGELDIVHLCRSEPGFPTAATVCRIVKPVYGIDADQVRAIGHESGKFPNP
jgi:hypothetical protein